MPQLQSLICMNRQEELEIHSIHVDGQPDYLM